MRARKIEGERKRVRQRLAAVREPGADDLFEPRAVAHGRGRLGETPQHDDGRVDAGARIERAGRDLERALGAHREPDRDGQTAVLRGPGLGEEPVRDIFLDHRDDALRRALERRQLHQQRRADVVGQVPGGAPVAPAGPAFVVEDERIALADVDAAQILPRAQDLDHPRVDVERRHVRAEADERRGQRAGARTDLEDAVPGRIDGQPRDARGRAAVHEEMLPEPLLRANPARAEQRARMRLGASVYLMRYTVTERRPNWFAWALELKPRSMRWPRIEPPVSPATAWP